MGTSAADLRSAFVAFFAERGHTVVPSASLVPDDPTLLFANAGMVQFKDTFQGVEERPYQCATSAQKCLRVTGKHNDLETVGPSPRHHTFFEMLGNFSFGAYFKSQAIRHAWEFMTGAMAIDPERLILTVHRDDDEALAVWLREIRVDPSRVLRMGDKTNFWMMADVGPCGPTSEIHYDYGRESCTCGEPGCSVELDNDCGRWLEVWNLVFMQYDQLPDGSRVPLPRTGVDTGMGLERLAAVKQGVTSNYDTDLFVPILDGVQEWLGHTTEQRREGLVGYRVLADHGRAMTFLVADGVLPGNDGRNYVLRLIMRRAMRFGKQLGLNEPFLERLVDRVIDTMVDTYAELGARRDWIREVASEEEARFDRTLASGLELLDGVIERAVLGGDTEIAGEDVFRLYDTFGFPPDLTRVVAEEHGLLIDRAGFESAMAAQRVRARAGAAFGLESAAEEYRRFGLPETEFLGYTSHAADGTIVALVADGVRRDAASVGEAVEVVLDRTPFYAQSGGQVGDVGRLTGSDGEFLVADTQSPARGIIVHSGTVEAGVLRVGDSVRAEVDETRRLDIMRNHTATHLLHAALQSVLGDHAEQRGSLVAPDRLRFDFAHLKAMTSAELREVERRVNGLVRQDEPVSWTVVPLDAARQAGAMMLFGEKYGAEVRMVTIGGVSKELCGGTHLKATGEIGSFVITGESSVGSGLRRIEARTGGGAEAYIRERLELLDNVTERLGVPSPERVLDRLEGLEKRIKGLEVDLELARSRLAASSADELLSSARDVDGVTVVAARADADSAETLRQRVDALRLRVGSGVIVLGAVVEGAPRLVAAVSDDAVARGLHAGRIVKAAAVLVGGSGGGRPQLAEAGGKDADRLDEALAVVADIVLEQMAATPA
jgi:alanyl-tRNA synthetase